MTLIGLRSVTLLILFAGPKKRFSLLQALKIRLNYLIII